MGVRREFSFEDDIELLDLKYQMDNGSFRDYFKEGTIEPAKEKNIVNEIEKPKNL